MVWGTEPSDAAFGRNMKLSQVVVKDMLFAHGLYILARSVVSGLFVAITSRTEGLAPERALMAIGCTCAFIRFLTFE